MIRIAICGNHGGFGISPTAIMYLIDKESELIHFATFDEYGFNLDEGFTYCGVTPIHVRGSYYSDYYGRVFDKEREVVVEVMYPRLDGEGNYNQIAFRSHPDLLEAIEILGEEAYTRYCRLQIVDIPDEDVTLDMLEIGEYDGAEWVAERHRTWS